MGFLVHFYWNAPGKTLRHYRGARLSKPMLNIVFKPYLSEGQGRREGGFKNQFTLWFLLKHIALNPDFNDNIVFLTQTN